MRLAERGPKLEASHKDRLLMVAPVNAMSCVDYVLTNTGTTAVYFTWAHEEVELPNGAKGGAAVSCNGIAY